MAILGLPSIHHPAWAVIEDGRIVVSIEEDRLHRQKNRFGIVDHHGVPNVLAGFHYCLNTAGIAVQDISDLVFGFNPSSLHQPDHRDYRQEFSHHERVFRQQQLLLDYLRRSEGVQAPVSYIRHHLAHAASVYFSSPFEDATILTVDGWGEDETLTVCKGVGTTITTLAVVTLPHSLGDLYTELTTKLGWGKDDAGKTMGLASYGSPYAIWGQKPLLRYGEPTDPTLWIDTSAAMHAVKTLVERNQGDALTEQQMNAAARIQHELEECLLAITRWAYAQTHQANLCLAGGVALNSVANYRLATETPFQRVFLQPACGDSGVPAGAALALYYRHHPDGERTVLQRPYFGRIYTDEQMRGAIGDLPYEVFHSSRELVQRAATLLVSQKIVGWFQEGCEFGPRALGHRSILADPRREDMKDRVNSSVKHREPFRPFAPAVLQERASEYFDFSAPNPFMLFVSPVRPEKRPQIPAVTHIDGTARLQTVSQANDVLFYQLISAFERMTGTPVILNTSFNVASSPIVETPEDAVRCFRTTDIDYLVMGPFLVKKEASPLEG